MASKKMESKKMACNQTTILAEEELAGLWFDFAQRIVPIKAETAF
jgi:hypothetical protein